MGVFSSNEGSNPSPSVRAGKRPQKRRLQGEPVAIWGRPPELSGPPTAAKSACVAQLPIARRSQTSALNFQSRAPRAGCVGDGISPSSGASRSTGRSWLVERCPGATPEAGLRSPSRMQRGAANCPHRVSSPGLPGALQVAAGGPAAAGGAQPPVGERPSEHFRPHAQSHGDSVNRWTAPSSLMDVTSALRVPGSRRPDSGLHRVRLSGGARSLADARARHTSGQGLSTATWNQVGSDQGAATTRRDQGWH